ncbi:unnamed protein product [Eruca vesicaria subsp. sativa]|uniref:Uncharacterized protein n=1 Tax=Eruca vesicaria subsp. sativa TaxID=29727 RepID=A0ABC8K1C0_ERUVS|nr:unnamed protein product [Eruca vesicaria subsp. sativa]
MMNARMVAFKKYLKLQSSEHTPSLISTDWIDFLEANTFQLMMYTIQVLEWIRIPSLRRLLKYDIVNLEDDSDVPSRNQNETPLS